MNERKQQIYTAAVPQPCRAGTSHQSRAAEFYNINNDGRSTGRGEIARIVYEQ